MGSRRVGSRLVSLSVAGGTEAQLLCLSPHKQLLCSFQSLGVAQWTGSDPLYSPDLKNYISLVTVTFSEDHKHPVGLGVIKPTGGSLPKSNLSDP